MAKLSAHGRELGRINYTTYSKAYMSDGTVLKNAGFGWKVFGKCKVSPQEAYQHALTAHNDFAASRPCLMAYRKELHALAGMGKAWKLHTAVELLRTDVDGIWSGACDGYGDNVHADLEEIEHLVNLYQRAQRELANVRVPAGEHYSQPA
jgi:hypothetical protein